MALEYYSGAGSITFRVTCTDPNSGDLVDPSSITLEVKDAQGVEYRYWVAASSIQPQTPMSSTATGEYYYVWSTATVAPGVYVAECAATRGGQPSVARLKVEVM